MQRTKFGIFTACVFGIALAAGCGGGSSGSTDAGDAETTIDTLVTVDLTYADELPGEAGAEGTVPGDTAGEAACVPECDQAGDRQCAPGVQGMYQVCAAAGGCLRWGTTQACPTGQACTGSLPGRRQAAPANA